jgi:iron complex outermembrane receptor protein
MISEELRITSPEAQGVFKWVGGIYMFEEENETDIDLVAWKEIRNTDMETRGYALFGEGTLTVSKRLHLTAGLRYSYEDMDGDLEGETIKEDLIFSESFDNDVLLPKFAVSYEFLPQLLTYATVSRGYYSGGFNSAAAVSPETFTYDPEYTWNHEIGIKSSWFNNRLNFNVALFYITIDDKQVAQLDGVTDARDIQNAAEAHSQGFEMELHAKPMPGTDIFAGIGYTDVVFDKWVAREQISPPGKPKQYAEYDYSDKQFPNAPEFTGNLGFQYRHKSGFYGRTDLIWSDDFYSDAKNTQKVDGRTLVNLRTGYEGENYDIILWCKNLLNEEYQTMGFARKFDQHVDGEPRMFGVTLTYHF